MKIAFIGFMGCGKSSVGKLVAEELDWEFLDLDEEIEKIAGKTIREIFKTHGEDAFRKLERKVLEDVLARKGNLIISLGGGAPAWKDNSELLKRGTLLVYLNAPFEILWDRISGDTERPLALLGKERVRDLFESRRKFYEKADIVVDTFGKSVEDVKREVLLAVEQFIGNKGEKAERN